MYEIKTCSYCDRGNVILDSMTPYVQGMSCDNMNPLVRIAPNGEKLICCEPKSIKTDAVLY